MGYVKWELGDGEYNGKNGAECEWVGRSFAKMTIYEIMRIPKIALHYFKCLDESKVENNGF